jgi:hypothetical protein
MMRTVIRVGMAAAATAVAPPRLLGAQTAIIAGTVMRDSSRASLGETMVSIASSNRNVRSNYLGQFRIDHLAAGTYLVTFRHLGFNPRTDTIAVTGGPLSRSIPFRAPLLRLSSRLLVGLCPGDRSSHMWPEGA